MVRLKPWDGLSRSHIVADVQLFASFLLVFFLLSLSFLYCCSAVALDHSIVGWDWSRVTRLDCRRSTHAQSVHVFAWSNELDICKVSNCSWCFFLIFFKRLCPCDFSVALTWATLWAGSFQIFGPDLICRWLFDALQHWGEKLHHSWIVSLSHAESRCTLFVFDRWDFSYCSLAHEPWISPGLDLLWLDWDQVIV